LGGLKREGKPFLAFPQLFFRLFSVRNIAGAAAHAKVPAEFIEYRPAGMRDPSPRSFMLNEPPFAFARFSHILATLHMFIEKREIVGMNQPPQQTRIGEKLLRRMPGYAFTGGRTINELAFGIRS
jgi:hypothetical protein